VAISLLLLPPLLPLTHSIVYLEEAHPIDGWLYPSVVHLIEQHATAQQRIEAARILQTEVEGTEAKAIPVYADSVLRVQYLWRMQRA
jgi:hypothetical protein